MERINRLSGMSRRGERIAATACPACGRPLAWVAQYGQWWCANEKKYYPPGPEPAGVAPATESAPAQASMPPTAQPVPTLWTQNSYRIRKKVLALTGQYWIEDQAGNQLGYSKQKLLRLKEDIRVYADQTMARELFQIRQTQILDVWGTFAIVDSGTNAILGYIRRRALASSFVRDEWEMRDQSNNLVGEIKESTGRGLARSTSPEAA